MTNSKFVPNNKPKQLNTKESVYEEHVKDKPTLGEKFVYECEDCSTQQKSEYVTHNRL